MTARVEEVEAALKWAESAIVDQERCPFDATFFERMQAKILAAEVLRLRQSSALLRSLLQSADAKLSLIVARGRTQWDRVGFDLSENEVNHTIGAIRAALGENL